MDIFWNYTFLFLCQAAQTSREMSILEVFLDSIAGEIGDYIYFFFCFKCANIKPPYTH